MKRAKWPTVHSTIFTASSNDSDPWDGDCPGLVSHRHDPSCLGDVRALLYPCSLHAQVTCEAAEKGRVVHIRVCMKRICFSIGTPSTSDVKLIWQAPGEEEDTTYANVIQALIYFDPDNADMELKNQSSLETIFAHDGTESYKILPTEHLRLHARRAWTIKLSSQHTFGLIFDSSDEMVTAIIDHVSQGNHKTFCNSNAHAIKELWRQKHYLSSNVTGNQRQNRLTTMSTQNASPGVDKSNSIQSIFQSNSTLVQTIKAKDGHIVVRKIVRSTSSVHAATHNWRKEYGILGKLSHPHIIKTLSSSFENLSIDFEYGGRDLALFRNGAHMFTVARNTEKVQQGIFRDLTSALSYVHNMHIKHMDMKPQNAVLSLDQEITKIIDFGHACSIDTIVKGGGTPHYIAPEFLLDGTTGAASDIWALGITMLYVANVIPLPGYGPRAETWQIGRLREDPQEAAKMTKWLRYVDKKKAEIPPAWSILKKLLEPDSAKRITAAQLSEELECRARSQRNGRSHALPHLLQCLEA